MISSIMEELQLDVTGSTLTTFECGRLQCKCFDSRTFPVGHSELAMGSFVK